MPCRQSPTKTKVAMYITKEAVRAFLHFFLINDFTFIPDYKV